MNRRDALKSLLAAPVAAAAVPVAAEPVSLGYADLSHLVGNVQPNSFLETVPGLRSMGPITVSMNWTPEPETIRLKGIPSIDTFGNPIRVDADFDMPTPGLSEVWVPLGDGDTEVFRDIGCRDAKGRRIFA